MRAHMRACGRACACVRVFALRFAEPPSRPPATTRVACCTGHGPLQPLLGATWHAACAFVALCCAARDALCCTRRTDLAAESTRARCTRRHRGVLHAIAVCCTPSRCAARRVVGRASFVAAHVRPARGAGPPPQQSAAWRSAVLAAGAAGDCGTQGANRHGGHRQAGCYRAAGARILPSPVNAGPGRGARRRQQSGRAPRPALSAAESGEPRAAGRVRALPVPGRALEGALPAGATQRHGRARLG